MFTAVVSMQSCSVDTSSHVLSMLLLFIPIESGILYSGLMVVFVDLVPFSSLFLFCVAVSLVF